MVRYVLLAALFTVTVGLQVRSVIPALRRVPTDFAEFAPAGDGTLYVVDAKAAAAGLRAAIFWWLSIIAPTPG